MMRILICCVPLLLAQVAQLAQAQTVQVAGKAAFAAWANGEATGDYTAYRALVGAGFHTFTHPLRSGDKPTQLQGPEARARMLTLTQERTQNPNHLIFSNVQASYGDSTAVFQFRSKGTVAGGYAYEGINVIAFTLRAGQVVGFQEYFGDVDPSWFR